MARWVMTKEVLEDLPKIEGRLKPSLFKNRHTLTFGIIRNSIKGSLYLILHMDGTFGLYKATEFYQIKKNVPEH